MDVDTQQGKIMGRVHVYTTHGNPDDSNPYMMLKHEVTNHLGPILKKLFHPSKVSLFKYLFSSILLCQSLEQNQCVFVYEDNLWAIKGRYEAVVDENEEVDWSVINHQFVLKLLCVCFILS
jgi:hypothetical protein